MVDGRQWATEQFEEHRGRLRAMAYRMLGSTADADDAVQEAWLRFNRSDGAGIDNLGGWLTTVVARVCLNMLQAQSRKISAPDTPGLAERPSEEGGEDDPEQEALLAEAVGLALLVVLDTLAPPERVALVLHDMFGVPFEQVGAVLGRSPAAARQLASRGRRRARETGTGPTGSRAEKAKLVEAFLAASRQGDLGALLAVLDPDIVIRADAAAVALGARAEARGAEVVAPLLRRAGGARPALVDGEPAAVWAPGGRLRAIFRFSVAGGRIAAIDLIGDPGRLAEANVVPVTPEKVVP
jgi:RNA polymerase sigma-70 factor (ECF subfamily)